ESVVAGDMAGETPRLVVLWLRQGQRFRDATFSPRGVPPKEEDQPLDLARGVTFFAPWPGLPSRGGYIHAFAGGVVGPPVIVALELVPSDHAQVQRDLTVGTPILERENPSTLAPIQHYGLAGEVAADSLTLFQLVRPGEGIPVVRMGT